MDTPSAAASTSVSVTVRRVLLVVLLGLASATYFGAIRRDLPHAPGSDEVDFLLIAVQIATSGDPNPHWFGHPGSTFIYPFAAGLHVAGALDGGPWVGVNPDLLLAIEAAPGRSILVGRLVSVVFALASLWLVVRVGDTAFGAPVGLVGGWLSYLTPLTLEHVITARTDGAGLFFGFLSLLALLRLRERPGRSAQVWAGITLGLGIATRYFIAAIGPLLLLVEVELWKRARASGGPAEATARRDILVGLLCVPAGLLLGAPFLPFEIPTLLESLAHEARGTHPGADGLGYTGNLLWYLGTGLPRALSAPLLGLAAVGSGAALYRRAPAPLLLLGFVVLFLGGISLAPLHWGRWLIQILPLVCLFSAAGLSTLVHVTADVGRLSRPARAVLLLVGLLAVSLTPARVYARFAFAQTQPNTREIARTWIVQNLAPSERIAADLYTAPLQNTPFDQTDYVYSWADVVESPGELRARGYDVAMVSSQVYRRFFSEPRRYARQVAFYRSLFRRHELLVEFRAAPDRRGPVIRLYRLDRPTARD